MITKDHYPNCPAIMQAAFNDGPFGFTINLKGESPGIGVGESGYVVSLLGYAEVFADRRPTPFELRRFILRNMGELTSPYSRYIGGWYDDGTDEYVLDVSVVVGSLREAIKLGIHHKQKAIFDLEDGSSITLNPLQEPC